MPKWTPAKTREKKKLFLSAYRADPCIARSAEAAKVSVDIVATWRKKDKKFIAALAKAEECGLDEIEANAKSRAAKFSDKLAIFFLSKRRAHIYGDKLTIGIDLEQLRELVSRLLAVLQSKLPRACPHCKTELNLSKPLAEALLKESAKFDQHGAAEGAV